MQYVYFSSQDSRNDQESTTYMIEHMWKNVRPENQEEHRLESKERKRDWKDVAKEKAAMETERTSSRLYMWASTTIHYIDIYKHNKQLGIPR